MINLEREQCTGCGACNNTCPTGSIGMNKDNEGFLYPIINNEKCTECGLCEKSCPILKKMKSRNSGNPRVYAAWSLDEEVRFNSTSGGLFTELAKLITCIGGYVAGAKYNKQHLVEHHIIGDEGEIPLLRQSKYVQSDKGLIFSEIKKLLEKDKLVMFVGSPCEGAGLLSYLHKSYDNLLLCDFICRGANSPKAYSKYLESLRKQYGSDIKTVWFKNKVNGWNKFCTKVEFENGSEYYADRHTDLFMSGYLKYNLFIRPSCSNCNYKGFPRYSDITLADYWGVKLEDESLDTDKGTSLILINSQKGQEYFNRLKGKIFQEESSLEVAVPFNQCAIKSVSVGEKRDYFFDNIDKFDFSELMKKIIEMGK